MKIKLKITIFAAAIVVAGAYGAYTANQHTDNMLLGDLQIENVEALGDNFEWPWEEWWNRKDYDCEANKCEINSFYYNKPKSKKVANGTGSVAHSGECDCDTYMTIINSH